MEALLRASCNQTGLFGPEWREVATMVFVQHLHLFNHSCYPNLAFDHVSGRTSRVYPRSEETRTQLVTGEDKEAKESMERHEAGGASEGSEFVLGSHGPAMAMVAVRDGEFCSLSMYCIVRKTILPALPL